MRKVLPIFLLVCILLNVLGVGLFFVVQQVSIKHEMRAKLKGLPCQNVRDLETVVLDPDHPNASLILEWEGNDEFRYGNEMYDVIDKHIQGNQLIIHCISDKKETALVKDFRKASEKQSGSQSTLLFRLLIMHYVPSFYTPLTAPIRSKAAYTAFLQPALHQQVRRIPVPPPQSA